MTEIETVVYFLKAMIRYLYSLQRLTFATQGKSVLNDL